VLCKEDLEELHEDLENLNIEKLKIL